MEKLIVKCEIYFVFLNIVITPKQKYFTIVSEQVINVSFPWYRISRKKAFQATLILKIKLRSLSL